LQEEIEFVGVGIDVGDGAVDGGQGSFVFDEVVIEEGQEDVAIALEAGDGGGDFALAVS
jgi:hypothetical protein